MRRITRFWKNTRWMIPALALLVISVSLSVSAAVTFTLKDGRMITVPVNRDEIITISFEEGATATGGKLGASVLPVTEGLVMWVDASDSSTLFKDAQENDPVTSGNQNVGLWKDKSGHDHHFSQARNDARPVFVKKGIGGKPSIMFDTSQSLLTKANFPAPVTIIYIARQTGGTNQRVLSGVANNWLLGYWGGAKNQAFYQEWVNPSRTPPTDDLQHVFSAVIKGPGHYSEIWADGVLVASSQSGFTGPNGLAINTGYASGETSNCEVAEIIVWRRAISSSERKSVEKYLQDKWRNTY